MAHKKLTPAEQRRRFIETARKLGVDASEEGFDDMLRRMSAAPPPKSVLKRKKTAPAKKR